MKEEIALGNVRATMRALEKFVRMYERDIQQVEDERHREFLKGRLSAFRSCLDLLRWDLDVD